MIEFSNRPFRFVLKGFVVIYQSLLSPIFGGNCRFYPSCSEYCMECLEEHDVLTSIRLTAIRLSKCHPYGPSGYDPVPANKKVSSL